MSGSEIQRIFEKLDEVGERLARLETSSESQSASMIRVESKVSDMAENGCAAGRDHSRRLDQLDQRPDRLVSIGSAVVAILSGIIAFFSSKGQ